MMQSLFDVSLLDSVLVQAALRAFALALVVGAVLFLLRVRNPHHQLAAWTAVLVGALAMPLLMYAMVVELPAREPAVPAGHIAEPLAAVATPEPLAAEVAQAPAAPAESAGFDWTVVLVCLYGVVAGALLLRLAVGIVLTARICKAAVRLRAPWTQGIDTRVSHGISAPVTAGSTILLPADFETWPAEKRQAVFLHERAHVARGDFYVQSLAAVHRAVFWFSPLAWWLHDRLAELAEDASDAEAAAALDYRADYAAVLLDFAQTEPAPRLQFAPLAVAMARPATVRRRIERVLEKKLPDAVGRGARAATALIVIGAACAAAVSIVRAPAKAAETIDVAPVPLIAASPLPAPEAAPIAPVAPVPPVGPGAHARHAADLDMDEVIREAMATATAPGVNVDEKLSARIEAAVARAQARAERAAAHVREHQRQHQYASAAAEPAGPTVRETRIVDAFTGVSFGGAGRVFITVGQKASVVLEGDAAIIGRTRTEVENGVLKIRTRNDDGFLNRGRGDITAHITVPELRVARVSGSGDLKVAGLNGGETELSISGSGSVEADGKLRELDLDISGSGSAKMDNLVVNEASVAISGSGSAVLDVRDDLRVRVSGSGSVRYLTQPKDIDTSISGSGSVRRRDAA